jgi:class 3 adenylate cyclase
VVNIASHLAKTLPPDRVFISHGTYCQLRDRGDLRLAEPQVMNGQGGTQIVYEVTSKV